MSIKEIWWLFNYSVIRLVIVPLARRFLRLTAIVEGEIPNIRPVFLAPVHRTSIDTYTLSYLSREFICYVSTDSFGHSRIANYLQRLATIAMGSVIWQKQGIAKTRQRALALANDVEDRLDRRVIVAAFTQGEYQPDSVDAVEDSLVGLLRRYEVRHLKQRGHELRIPVVPVGIEYDLDGMGLVLSGFAKFLATYVPYFPHWTVPAMGTRITLRFGEPQYFDGRDASAVTDSVMRESARLSRIPYNAGEYASKLPGEVAISAD